MTGAEAACYEEYMKPEYDLSDGDMLRACIVTVGRLLDENKSLSAEVHRLRAQVGLEVQESVRK